MNKKIKLFLVLWHRRWQTWRMTDAQAENVKKYRQVKPI